MKRTICWVAMPGLGERSPEHPACGPAPACLPISAQECQRCQQTDIPRQQQRRTRKALFARDRFRLYVISVAFGLFYSPKPLLHFLLSPCSLSPSPPPLLQPHRRFQTRTTVLLFTNHWQTGTHRMPLGSTPARTRFQPCT